MAALFLRPGGLQQGVCDYYCLISEKKWNRSREVNQMANYTTVQAFGLRKICCLHFTIKFVNIIQLNLIMNILFIIPS